MSPLEKYRRALRRALDTANEELGYLESTQGEVLAATPERVLEVSQSAGRMATRLERRGRVLQRRAEQLAEALGSDGASLTQLMKRVEAAPRAELETIAASLRLRGGALEAERRRFRQSLQLGHAVVRGILHSMVQDEPPVGSRRFYRGRRPAHVGVLNRKA